MFGFGAEYARGRQTELTTQQLRDARTQRDDTRTMNEWESALYRARSEADAARAALAKANAETTVARVQRGIALMMMDKLTDTLRAADPANPLCNEVQRAGEMQLQADIELAEYGLALIRTPGQPSEIVGY